MSWLDAYQLDKRLGTGGSAEVWAATDAAGKQVALRRLLPEAASDVAERLSFYEEAQLLMRLSHYNLRRCYEVHDEPMGQVLEYVAGEPLSRILAAHPGGLPLKQAALIAHEVASALAYLHQQRVMHLEVVPPNVMVAKGGRVVLIDLTHGRWPERRTQVTWHKTPTGAQHGYYYPELWADGELSFASDVYRLGLLLWECLAGAEPELAGPLQAGKPFPGLVRPETQLADQPQHVYALLRELTQVQPEARPPADTALLAKLWELYAG